MPNVEKAMVTASLEGKSWKQELFKYLRNYRATPHSSTQTPPATALFSRPLSIRLPNVASRGNPDLDADIREQDHKAKERMRMSCTLRPGDKVLVRQC